MVNPGTGRVLIGWDPGMRTGVVYATKSDAGDILVFDAAVVPDSHTAAIADEVRRRFTRCSDGALYGKPCAHRGPLEPRKKSPGTGGTGTNPSQSGERPHPGACAGHPVSPYPTKR